MRELDKALAEISHIRRQMAAGTMFCGFGPAVMAASGILGLGAAAVHAGLLGAESLQPQPFVMYWAAIAIFAGAIIAFEMYARTHRTHGGLADEMLFAAAEHFIPVGAVGAVLALLVVRVAPDAAWMLPGLWSLLISLGLFAAVRFLPRVVVFAAAWYFVAGLVVLIMGAEQRTLSPWFMGVPFGVGQLLLAGILKWSYAGQGEPHDD